MESEAALQRKLDARNLDDLGTKKADSVRRGEGCAKESSHGAQGRLSKRAQSALRETRAYKSRTKRSKGRGAKPFPRTALHKRMQSGDV